MCAGEQERFLQRLVFAFGFFQALLHGLWAEALKVGVGCNGQGGHRLAEALDGGGVIRAGAVPQRGGQRGCLAHGNDGALLVLQRAQAVGEGFDQRLRQAGSAQLACVVADRRRQRLQCRALARQRGAVHGQAAECGECRECEALCASELHAQGMEREVGNGERVGVEVVRTGELFAAAEKALLEQAQHARRQRHHQHHADQIEHGMEEGNHQGRYRWLFQVGIQPAEQADEHGQEQQRHRAGHEVEDHMCCGEPARIGRGADGRQDGGGDGADIGADQHRAGRLHRHQAALGGGDDDRDDRARGLHQHPEQGADADQDEPAGETGGDEILQRAQAAQGRKTVLEAVDAEEEHAEARQRLSECARTQGAATEHQEGTEADEGHGEDVDLQAQAQSGNQPGVHRRADVGAEEHPQGIAHRQQAGVDEADAGDGDGGGGLHQRGDQHACGKTAGRGGGAALEQALQGVAGGQLQALGHHVHADQEQADAPGERRDQFESGGGKRFQGSAPRRVDSRRA